MIFEKTTNSRTEYSARNVSLAMIGRIAALLMGFVARIVFTHTLEEAYVGVNGLFSDILYVLSLSELGFGTAITYALYKPISENDIEKQKSYMKLYKYYYRLVAVIVLCIGLCITPFLDVIIKNKPDIPNLVIIYLMYLANSVLSYLLIYKKTIIDAHQMAYIGTIYQTSAWIIQTIIQIVILIVTHNYILYLSITFLSTFISNLLISKKADRMYPFLTDKNVTPLPKEDRKSIFVNIKAMMVHKVCDVCVNNTDNILLSSLVGITAAGSYSNYYLIIASIKGIYNQIFNGITASVGNMGVEEKPERIKKIFEATFFISNWMYGLAAICLYEVLTPFIEICFGKQFVFEMSITLVLCINFYIGGLRQAILTFRDSLGLFNYDRAKSVAAAIVNLIVSVVLGNLLGTIGIFIGTLICMISTYFWVEPIILYKKCLNSSAKGFFAKYGIYSAVTAILWLASDFVCKNVVGNNIKMVVGRILISVIIINVGYLICFYRTKEFKLLFSKAKGLLMK